MEQCESGWAAPIDGLIGLRREAERLAEEWQRTREPGAEGHTARVAIETLQALTFRTVTQLSQRAEPVTAVELGRLSLALQRIENADQRIENADRLRIEREQVAAEAEAQRERVASWAGLSHAEQVQKIRRSIGENLPGWPARAEAPDSEWAEDSGGDLDAAPPAPAPDAPFDDGGTPDAWGAPDETDEEEANVTESASDASEAPDTRDAPVTRDGRDAPDDDAYTVARDVEMRRRDRERLLWPTDPPFCPALWHTFG